MSVHRRHRARHPARRVILHVLAVDARRGEIICEVAGDETVEVGEVVPRSRRGRARLEPVYPRRRCRHAPEPSPRRHPQAHPVDVNTPDEVHREIKNALNRAKHRDPNGPPPVQRVST